MTKLLFFILFLSGPIFVFGQTRLDSMISVGKEYIFNFQFNDAEKIFNESIHSFPNSPLGYFYISKIHLWYYLGSNQDEEYQKFMLYSDSVFIKSEKLLEEEDNNYKIKYLIADNYLNRATALFKKGNSIETFLTIKTAVSYYEEIRENDSDFYDTYLGLGIISYALSFVPEFLQWTLNLMGMDADKDKGIQYLKLSYKYGKTTKIESAFHLGKLYTEYIADYDSAFFYLSMILTKYPNNSLFHYQYALLLMNKRDLEGAEKELKEVIRLNNDKFSQTSAFAKFLLAEIYFKKNEFNEALEYYNLFLNETTNIDYTGIASYNLAICYLFLELNNEYKKHLMLARNGNLNILDDVYAKRRSEIIFSKNISEFQKKIILSKNDIYNAKYDSAYNRLISILDYLDSDDLKGEALIIISESLIEMGRYNESLKYLNNISFEEEKWIEPLSYYLLARVYLEQKQIELVHDNIEKAESANNFDFRDKISPKINYIKNIAVSDKNN
ncbi:tetratricopeptide repeat protein [Bacteroidota bacterium]